MLNFPHELQTIRLTSIALHTTLTHVPTKEDRLPWTLSLQWAFNINTIKGIPTLSTTLRSTSLCRFELFTASNNHRCDNKKNNNNSSHKQHTHQHSHSHSLCLMNNSHSCVPHWSDISKCWMLAAKETSLIASIVSHGNTSYPRQKPPNSQTTFG